jgi:NAD-reducing hydrogenase small subunit
MSAPQKVRVATIWLSGCSGCHMSFLDQDEALIDLANKIDLVYSPIVDVKEFPENVTVTLIEGAVANEDQLEMLQNARQRSKILISLGDCAVTGNLPGLRNAWPNSAQAIVERAYIETADVQPQIPTDVPDLLPNARALHDFVNIDFYIPGCPPPASLISYVIGELLAGRTPNMEGKSKYG